MRNLLPVILLIGAVALAITIGTRMSTDAMAVVIGVAVGVAASVPTSLLLIALVRKERQSGFREQPGEQPWRNPYEQLPPGVGMQPNILVLDPTQMLAMQQRNQQVPLPPPDYQPDGGMRRLRVVGSEDDWNDR